MALTEDASPASLKNVVEFIETSLADLDEPVDRIIADYAGRQALDRENKHR